MNGRLPCWFWMLFIGFVCVLLVLLSLVSVGAVSAGVLQATDTPTPTATVTVVSTATLAPLGTYAPGDRRFEFWYYYVFGLLFLFAGLYWEGLFFFFISPKLFASEEAVPGIIAITVILFSMRSAVKKLFGRRGGFGDEK